MEPESEAVRQLKELYRKEADLRREALYGGRALWETWLRCVEQGWLEKNPR